MTTLRTDIEKALDELISNEEGMRFQGIAVVLAKQRWPEFVASERKKDLGLDAYTPASVARDGVGKALACSLTTTLDKIKGDIERFQPYANDVKVLLFATPQKVTNYTSTAWAGTINSQYGIELVILSREDIITELMLPSNASICRSHLRLNISVEPTVSELVENVRGATAEVIDGWLRHSFPYGTARISLQALKLEKDGKETEEFLSQDDLQAALLESRRIIIEAPAGRGKTTTLSCVAESLCDKGGVPFLVDLPGWVARHVDILEYLSSMPPFLARSISAGDLAKLREAVPVSFLLNGWNEISSGQADESARVLEELERNFPKAGILVATRTQHTPPPLPGSFRVKLLSLTRVQRTDYLFQTLSHRADELVAQLDADPVLDDLTRTPLLLAEVTKIFLSGEAIPKTKVGVLDAAINLHEQADHHRDHLHLPPLAGNSHHYLSELAAQMTANDEVSILEESARSIIHSISRTLIENGQIGVLPEPAVILRILSAHHILERVEYPERGYRFQHQQFQELYASIMLNRKLLSLIERNDSDGLRRFTSDYINSPSWEEPLKLLAERVGEVEANSRLKEKVVKTGKSLVEMTLEVDPVFSADLARLCGPHVWKEVRRVVGECLRSWHLLGEQHHRECATAGMLASGSDDFVDILLPLLTSADQEVRLTTYRAWKEFHVTSLGVNWREVVAGWEEALRAEFILEVVRESWMHGIAEEFAKTDPSSAVRSAALSSLEWIQAFDSIARILSAYEDIELEEVMQERSYDFEDIPPKLRTRVVLVLERLLQKAKNVDGRLRLLLRIDKAEGKCVFEHVKEELTNWPYGQEKVCNDYFLKSVLEYVQGDDPEWISEWVVRRILDGSVSGHFASQFVSVVPDSIIQEQLARIKNPELSHIEIHRIISVLAASTGHDVPANVFSTLCMLRREILSVPRESSSDFQSSYRNLEGLFHAIPAAAMISGILSQLSPQFDHIQYYVISGLVGRIGADGDDLRSQVTDDLRQSFRGYLKGGLAHVLSENDYSGELKMHLSMALARVGDSEDIEDLKRLIKVDILRVRHAREVQSSGVRSHFAVMSCSNGHVRALEILDPSRAEDVLLELLCEPEYENEAVNTLIRLSKVNTTETGLGFKRRDYSLVWEARSGRSTNEFKEGSRLRFIVAIKERISALIEERSHGSSPDFLSGRLKKFACALAVLDDRDSAELVIELIGLPGEWDDWIRAEALETLLYSGAHLRAEPVMMVVNPIIEKIVSRKFYDQQADYLLQRFLCILPFIDPPSTGITRVKEVIASSQFPAYRLRDVLPALGNSRCNDALDILLDVAGSDEKQFQNFGAEWVDAVAALDSTESKHILLSLVDPDTRCDHYKQLHLEDHARKKLALHIVEIARMDSSIMNQLYSLCGRRHSRESLVLLAEVVAGIGTMEALMAGLDLLSDHAQQRLPYEFMQGIERAFLEQIPVTPLGNAYNLQPRSANDIRHRLFQMVVEDDDRRYSAWALLGQIESWRLEHGRPRNEHRHPAFDSGLPWPPISLMSNCEEMRDR